MKSEISQRLPQRRVFFWLACVCFFVSTEMVSAEAVSEKSPSTAEVITISDFELGSRSWETKAFQGLTRYSIVDEAGSKVLAAHSQDSASGVFFEFEYSLEDFPILSWRWKIERTLAKGDARTKAGDDYAARIYVVFPHWFFPKTRSINYIWANKLPKGEAIANPFTSNAMMLALQSGDEQAGVWITERRDVREDYLRLFGEEPSAVGAIAIMTDTDNSHSEAKAWFDDLRIERVRP